MGYKRAALTAALCVLVCAGLCAQMPAGGGRGDFFTVKVAVVGPGDELYLWWGHIGIIVEDALNGKSVLYDWGVFSFENKNFFLNFAFGRLLYSCMVSPSDLNFARNIVQNRDITVYTLDLPAEKKLELVRFAENNVLPENRDYWYHHFDDNCATRVRDILDTATGGAFAARYRNAPGRFTLREHVRRHTWFSPFWDWFLNFLMGQDIDKPIMVWEEMFLPSEIGMQIDDFTYTDAWGNERKLVSGVEVINRAAGRPAVLAAPPPKKIWPLVVGLALAAAGLFAAGSGKKRKLFRVLDGVFQAVLGLWFGAAGLVLYFMSFFTNHDYTYHNLNVFVHPLLLAALPLGLIAAFGKHEQKRARVLCLLRVLWTTVFSAGLVCAALSVLLGQQNGATLALVLPVSLALSFLPETAQNLYARRGEKTKAGGDSLWK
jgi:hypothetical protein